MAFFCKQKLLGFGIVVPGDDKLKTVQDTFDMRTIRILILSLFATAANAAVVYDCYTPIPGGWEIHLTGNKNALHGDPTKTIGVVSANGGYNGDPRQHRRPLFPDCDRGMLFSSAELKRLERVPFRPLVLAYNVPRFLFDYHAAGGLLGHLMLGLLAKDGTSKWFHQWSEIDLRYVEGRMEYELRDPSFPGVRVRLSAIAMSGSAGLLVELAIEGLPKGTSLVWMYGGASAYFTNWAMNAPEFAFAPTQCGKDWVRWEDGAFTLTRAFDKSDIVMNEVFAVARRLPEWKALIQGGCSWKGKAGIGDPQAVLRSPADLIRATRWQPPGEQPNCVAVYQAELPARRATGFVVVGMGGNIKEAIRHPQAAKKAALARNRSIAGRIATKTPDALLDAAMPMMAFATEGTWADQAYVHGGWSWRFAYLGWRSLYGPTCYGWTNNVEKTLRNHARLNRVPKGPDKSALGSMLEYDPGVFYNMNEVFLDQVRHYFDYTGDLELMRELYPVCEGILQWEDRRLRPGEEPLYENALNTWISDQHWYTRAQCTQASAYMLGANTFMADLATRLGKDPTPFRERAAAIRDAMQRKLWLPQQGVFAEYLDTLGDRMLHSEPELPTIYHSAEFGAASPTQIFQMLQWAHNHLPSVSTPNRGKLYFSSNWYPNMARSYTHSTYEMAYAEELNFALTHYLAGLSDDAYAIIRACLCGIFNGPTPGGLACHSYTDGRQRANDEFADAISMWGRTITEGLFGIVPQRADGIVTLSPQFPTDWPEAAIRTPQFSYKWRRGVSETEIEWTSPVTTKVRLRLPFRSREVEGVRANGRKIDFAIETGNGLNWLMLQTPPTRKGSLAIKWKPSTQGSDALPATLALAQLTTVSPTDSASGLTPTKVWSAPKVPARDLNHWTALDLRPLFNASVPEVMQRVHAAVKPPAAPASPVNTAYYKDHLVAPFVSPKPSDDAWRKKVEADGMAWTADGIPFLSSKEGPNIAVVTRAAVFPQTLTVPVSQSGKTLYLMISGTTFAMQSHVPNLRVTLRYEDGKSESIELVNPTGIGDCWNQYRYHDTAANGFENIGGRSGPAGSAAVPDLTKPVAVDTEAHLVALDLQPGKALRELVLEAVANDVIFGLMGATILK